MSSNNAIIKLWQISIAVILKTKKWSPPSALIVAKDAIFGTFWWSNLTIGIRVVRRPPIKNYSNNRPSYAKEPSFLRATQPCSNKLSRILSKLKLLSLKVRKVDRNLRKRVLTMGLEFETLKLRRSIKNGARSMSLKWDG